MIQDFTITAPLGDVDPDAATATLNEATGKLARLHPALRAAAVTHAQGVLTMNLTVSGTDRWVTQRAARKIATSMLARVKIPVAGAVLELVRTPPNTRSLTAAQGRSVTRGRGRGTDAWHIDSKMASEDPS